ncbi:MAG: type II secretion system minor pseudopilin GspK [Gammaproteobacteria bacterium]
MTTPGPARQCGVALVTALLVVSLATMAAVAMATRQHVDVRRTANLLHGEQAYAYAIAAESWAQVILRYDIEDSRIDTLEEDWATALPPISVEGGFVNGRITDQQGRFNINNLLGENGDPSIADLEYFRRLLAVLELDPAIAVALLDWLDANIDASFPDGAEDGAYLLAEPPYRAANRKMVSISELRLVKGFTPEVMAALAPHVTALPERTTINVNTATLEVLQALHAELTATGAGALIEGRGEEGYVDKNTFLAVDALAGLELDVAVDVTSDWFRVLTDVTVGSGRATLASLLRRQDNTTQIVSRIRSQAQLLPPE